MNSFTPDAQHLAQHSTAQMHSTLLGMRVLLSGSTALFGLQYELQSDHGAPGVWQTIYTGTLCDCPCMLHQTQRANRGSAECRRHPELHQHALGPGGEDPVPGAWREPHHPAGAVGHTGAAAQTGGWGHTMRGMPGDACEGDTCMSPGHLRGRMPEIWVVHMHVCLGMAAA